MSVIDKKQLEIELNQYTGADKPAKYTEMLYAEYINEFSPFIPLRNNVIDLIKDFIVININSDKSCIFGKIEKLNLLSIDCKKEYLSEENIRKIFNTENFEPYNKIKCEKLNDENYYSVKDVAEKIFNKTVTEFELGMIVIGDDKFEATEQDVLDIYCNTLYDRPNYECIKNLLTQKENIKLILTDERLKKINRLKSDQKYKKICDSFIKEAEKNLVNTCENLQTDWYNRLRIVSQRAVERVPSAIIAYLLTDDTRFLEYAKSEVMYICTEINDWEFMSYRSLTTAHFAALVAFAYNWIPECFTEEEKRIIEYKLYYEAVLPAFMNFYKEGKNDVGLDNNRTMIVYGSIALAAFVICDRYPAICANVISNSIISYELPLLTMYPSGRWFEGVRYTEYTFSNVLFFIDVLKTTFGTDFNLTKTPCFEKLVNTTKAMFGSTGSVNFGDDYIYEDFVGNWIYLFADIFDDNEAAVERARQLEKDTPSWMDVVCYSDTSIGSNTEIQKDVYLKKDELVLMRDSFEKECSTFVAFKSGYTHISHGHFDSGSFVIDMMGERFAGDIGKGDYSLTGYSGLEPREKFKYYVANAEGHNTIVINPDDELQHNIGNEAYCDVFDAFETINFREDNPFAITDLSNAYCHKAKNVRRGVMMTDNRKSVVIRDEIELKDEKNNIYWFMHVKDGDIEIADNNTAFITVNKKTVKLSLITDAKEYELKVMDAVPLASSPKTLAQERTYDDFKKIAIKTTCNEHLNITVKIQPVTEDLICTPVADIPLKDWNN